MSRQKTAAPQAARDQIALIAGSAETPIRIRAIHCDRSEEGRQKHPSHEYEGALAGIAERTRKLNLDGHNIYMVAQPTKPLPADGYFTRDADIIGVRCLYADGDNSELPSEWHVEPAFILVHPKTGRWWAFWSVRLFPLADLRDMIKRIAIHYDGDISICNPARIVRLAGYDRWKAGKNYGPYELQRRSGTSTEQWRHEGLPPAPARKRYEGRADAMDLIELDRLRKLLALAPPFDRGDWLKVMFAIRDGTVIDDKFAVLDEADKLALFDEWASRTLYETATGPKLPGYHVGNYGGYEDNEYHWNSPKSDTDEPVGFGSLIHLAKMNAANHDVPFPAELGRPGVRESLHKSGSKFENYSAKPEPELSRGDVEKPAGLYDGPEYANRPEPPWLIRNIAVEAGYSIASGRSQAGKSFCELAQALSIATGKPWLGEWVEKTGPVLYVAAEGQGRIWKDVRAWCAEFDVDPESLRGKFFIYDRSARLNTEAGREALADILRYIKQITGQPPILAVFDTLRRNMRGGVSQEEPTSEVLHAVNELQAAGIAVTLVAHHGRGHDETKGLTEWEDDADQVRIYHGTVRDGTTKIEFKKVKSTEDGWSIAVEYTTHELPDSTTTKVAVAGQRKQREETGSARKDLIMKEIAERAAIEILEDCDPPKMSRTKLASAVCQKLGLELKEKEPEKFSQQVRNFARHFGRLKHGELFECAAEWGIGRNQEILSFAKPGRGRRAARPRDRNVLKHILQSYETREV